MYITHDLPLEREDHFDRPSTTKVHTAVILRGSTTDIHRAEEQFGRSVLYAPRKTERSRPTGRSRVLRTIVLFQWPGYAFLHSSYEHHLDELRSRYHLRHMKSDTITRIPVSYLRPSRDLEILSRSETTQPAPPPARPETRPPRSPDPAVGDLVSVQAGEWSDFTGVVREIRRGHILVDVPHADFCIRAHPSAVRVIDRKKVLA